MLSASPAGEWLLDQCYVCVAIGRNRHLYQTPYFEAYIKPHYSDPRSYSHVVVTRRSYASLIHIVIYIVIHIVITPLTRIPHGLSAKLSKR